MLGLHHLPSTLVCPFNAEKSLINFVCVQRSSACQISGHTSVQSEAKRTNTDSTCYCYTIFRAKMIKLLTYTAFNMI